MDPFTICINALTVLQATSTVLSLCYKLRAGLIKVPRELLKIINDIRELRNLVEALHSATEQCDPNLIGSSQSDEVLALERLNDVIQTPLASCMDKMVASRRY
jgi:hypothetical protein